MKNLTKMIIIVIQCVLVVFIASCGRNNEESDSGELVNTGYILAADGKTEYSVVIPSKPVEYEQFAASELIRLFAEATGATLSLLSDNDESAVFSENSKLISISKTAVQKDSGVTADYSVYRNSGARIVTLGGCVILTGGSPEGALYAVYDFLGILFDYEYYSVDTYRLEKKETVMLPKLNESNIPDNDCRMYLDYVHYSMVGGGDKYNSYRHRLAGSGDGWALQGHAVDVLIPYNKNKDLHPSWFGGSIVNMYGQTWSQLCYTNEEMKEGFIERVKYYIEQNPETTRISLGQSDVNSWCECANCSKIMDKYDNHGSMSSRGAITQTIFINDVVKKVDEWMKDKWPERNMNYYIYAYHQTVDAPAHYDATAEKYVPNGSENGDYSMVLDERVILWYADIYANRNISFRENSGVAKNLRAWSALTSGIFMYEYPQDATHVCLPYDGLHVFGENLRFTHELGFYNYVFQGVGNGQASGFTDLKLHVASKLMWDTSLNANDLAYEYIENCYGPAAEKMKEYFDALRMRLSMLRSEYNYGYMCLGSIVSPVHWPRTLILAYYQMFDEMYSAIENLRYTDSENYEKIFRKIKIEQAFLDYVNGNLYMNYFSTEEKNAFIDEFEYWTTKYGVKVWNEVEPMSDVITRWRIS